MADQVPITAGSGTSISTDDCGASGHVQRVKIAYGADGDATQVGADANGIDVDVTRIVGKTPVYTEADTDASIDGIPILWEDAADTLRPASAAKPLPVNIISGSSSGVQYDEAATDATITGTAVMWEDTADTLRSVSAAKPLPVNIITGSSSGVQYTEADVDTTITGTAVMWEDTGDTLRAASVTKPLPVQAPAATRTTHSISVALQTDAIQNALTTLTPKFFTETVVSADTDEELIAAVGGKKLRILALAVQCAGTATTILFESSTTTRIHRVPAGANGGQILPFNPVGWFETASGASLTATLTAGSDADISGVYVEV